MSCLQDLLKTGIDCGASDIHVMVGSPPLLRIHTKLQETDYPVVTAESAEAMVREMLPEHRFEQFIKLRDADFSAEVTDKGRFRVNAHYQRGSIAIAFRTIPCFARNPCLAILTELLSSRSRTDRLRLIQTRSQMAVSFAQRKW